MASIDPVKNAVTDLNNSIKNAYINEVKNYITAYNTVRKDLIPEVREQYSINTVMKSVPEYFLLHSSTVRRLQDSINPFDKELYIIVPPTYDTVKKLTDKRGSVTFNTSGKYAKTDTGISMIHVSYIFIEWLSEISTKMKGLMSPPKQFTSLPQEVQQMIISKAAKTDFISATALKLTSKGMKAMLPGKIKGLPEKYFSSNHPAFMNAYHDALWTYRTDKHPDEIISNVNYNNNYKKYSVIKQVVNGSYILDEEYNNITISDIIEAKREIMHPEIIEMFQDFNIYNEVIKMYFTLMNATHNTNTSGLTYINEIRDLFQYKAYFYAKNSHSRNQNILIAFELSKLQVNIWLRMEDTHIFKKEEVNEAFKYIIYYQKKGLDGFIPVANIYTQLYYHYVYLFIKLRSSSDEDVWSEEFILYGDTKRLYNKAKELPDFRQHTNLNDTAHTTIMSGKNTNNIVQKYMTHILSDEPEYMKLQKISMIV